MGSFKAAIISTCRSVKSKRVPRYLAAMIPHLTWAATRTTPVPYRLLKLAQVHA